MRILLAMALALLTTIASATAEKTVMAQISAMQNDDWPEAWSLASEGIRRTFGSAANFRTLVESRYKEILDAVDSEVKSSRSTDRVALVIVELLSADFNLTDAVYILSLERGQWRIISVELRPGRQSI